MARERTRSCTWMGASERGERVTRARAYTRNRLNIIACETVIVVSPWISYGLNRCNIPTRLELNKVRKRKRVTFFILRFHLSTSFSSPSDRSSSLLLLVYRPCDHQFITNSVFSIGTANTRTILLDCEFSNAVNFSLNIIRRFEEIWMQ